MTPIVLVDTAAWIALVNTRDELHKRAEKVMAELRHRDVVLVTTEFVTSVRDHIKPRTDCLGGFLKNRS